MNYETAELEQRIKKQRRLVAQILCMNPIPKNRWEQEADCLEKLYKARRQIHLDALIVRTMKS